MDINKDSTLIAKYFPNLTDLQSERFMRMEALYGEWNANINVISRKDINHLYERHVLHSMAILKFFDFEAKTTFLDIGTGGGFPGIPLAIMLPRCQFHLVDATRKKTTVAREVATALGLKNVTVDWTRAEELKKRYDFTLARAVTRLSALWQWSRHLLAYRHSNKFANGLIALKGGHIGVETKLTGQAVQKHLISDVFAEDFYKEKYVLYIAR